MSEPDRRRFLLWLEQLEHGQWPDSHDRREPLTSLRQLALSAVAQAEATLARVGGDALLESVACRAGCHYCCTLPVETSMPEAIQLWLYAREHLDETRMKALKERIATAATGYAECHSEAELEALNQPCPLLVEGQCSVHPARPLTCRGANSLDAEACRREFSGAQRDRGVPVNRRLQLAYVNIGDALVRGVARAGRSGPDYLVNLLAILAAAPSPESVARDWLEKADRGAGHHPGS